MRLPKSNLTALAVFSTLVGIAPPAGAATAARTLVDADFSVTIDGDDANSCLGDHPCRTIQRAIARRGKRGRPLLVGP
jgi:hypothetical protein